MDKFIKELTEYFTEPKNEHFDFTDTLFDHHHVNIRIKLINVFGNVFELIIRLNCIFYYYKFTGLTRLVKFYDNLEQTHRYYNFKIMTLKEYYAELGKKEDEEEDVIINSINITELDVEYIDEYLKQMGLIKYDYSYYNKKITPLPIIATFDTKEITIQIYKELNYVLYIYDKEQHCLFYKQYEKLIDCLQELNNLKKTHKCEYDTFEFTNKLVNITEYEQNKRKQEQIIALWK
jgi:hypothetical protein